MSRRLRVVLAGTPEFAAIALRHLLEARFDVSMVLTQPDRPAGRGLRLHASPVKQLAEAHGLAVHQPRGLRLDGRFPDDARAAQAALARARPDVMVVAAYGLILPAWVLELPRLGCLNIHASLLPRWRGAAPIQRAIEAGDVTTGVTIMQMDEGLDTGPMLMLEPMPIGRWDTSATLHERLAAVGARLIVDALEAAACGALRSQAQPAEGVTYASKIDKGEARIEWNDPATVIERRVRAFDPSPGCHFDHNGETIKLWRADVSAGFAAAPGAIRVEGDRLRVACGEDALDLMTLQRPGGRRIPVAAFLAVRPSR